MGTVPGISPGKIACGKASRCPLAPSSTGGSFTNVSSSLGNLKPFFLKASPKSLSSGKLLWQVLHEVWYFRENAGIADARGTDPTTNQRKTPNPKAMTNKLAISLRRLMDAASSVFVNQSSMAL